MTEIPIREAFSSRRDAEAARDRLEYGGFARRRIQLLRVGNEFVVILYAQPEETEHAQDLINKAGWLPDWGRRVAEHAPTPSQTLLGLAAIAGAGAALYWAVSQFQQNSGSRQLRFGRDAWRGSSRGTGGAGNERHHDRPASTTAGVASSGIASRLQPGGTVPGGGPGASVGSIGTRGGQS